MSPRRSDDKPMTTMRAIRTVNRLLQRVEHELGTTPPIYVSAEEREAIRFMRDLAANSPSPATRTEERRPQP